MSTSIVEPIIPHIPTILYIIGSCIIFLAVSLMALPLGKLFSALMGGVATTIMLLAGFIPYYLAVIFYFIVAIELYFVFVRKPKEDKQETPQKPQEITGVFDKSQFKRGKQ